MLFFGAMIGLEQTVVPLIGKCEFNVESSAILLLFIASFGAVKAILNLLAGNLYDKWGRKNAKGIMLLSLNEYKIKLMGHHRSS